MEFRNYTPHEINLLGVNFPSLGVARVKMVEKVWDQPDFNGGCIDVITEEPGQVTGLPDPETDVYYLVSRVVKSALPGRTDLAVPTRFTRDEAGRITGAQAVIV